MTGDKLPDEILAQLDAAEEAQNVRRAFQIGREAAALIAGAEGDGLDGGRALYLARAYIMALLGGDDSCSG